MRWLLLSQPATTPTPAARLTAPALQDTGAKLGETRTLREITPIPSASSAPIEVPAMPTEGPTTVEGEDPMDLKETSASDDGAYRFVLPSALGKHVSADEYLERGNVILV